MLDEANSILYQRRQNVRSKKLIYTLKLLPKHMKQITKCHAFQVNVVVEKLHGVCVCAYVSLCVCVCVCVWCPRCAVGSFHGLFGRFRRVSFCIPCETVEVRYAGVDRAAGSWGKWYRLRLDT